MEPDHISEAADAEIAQLFERIVAAKDDQMKQRVYLQVAIEQLVLFRMELRAIRQLLESGRGA